MAANATKRNASGSALVIVLGILSVLMLMAVAFSTYMRTERGAMTNLKNAHVAEQTLHSALALAIQSIEDSLSEMTNGVGDAALDSPVAVWPQPWLASCAPADRGYAADEDDRNREKSSKNDGCFQSRLREDFDATQSRDNQMREDDTSAQPGVLCPGAAEFLTSNQIAMVRSAAVDWAPIYSGIGASSIASENENAKGANAGYPQNSESIVGRYAFVALDTTGYLDLGKIGGMNAAARKSDDDPSDPWLFIPAEDRYAAKAPNGKEIPNPLSSRSRLSSALNSSKAFVSFADAKTGNGAGFRLGNPYKFRNEDFMPPDLYAGTGVSLEALTPEGEPKVAIPYGTAGAKLNGDDLEDFALRAYSAMVSVFARSRREGGVNEWWKDGDRFHLFEGAGGILDLYVPKAALATVGLLDAVDGDSVPGKKAGNSDSYWTILYGNNGKLDVKMWDDSRTDRSGDILRTVSSAIDGSSIDNPLNYPCTVGAPLVKAFYAYVTIDHDSRTERQNPERNPNPKWGGGQANTNFLWQVEYNAELHVGAVAADDNRDDSDDARNLSAELDVMFDVMTAAPSAYGKVSAGNEANGHVKTDLVEFNSEPNSSYTPEIKWDGLWLANQTISSEKTEITESVGAGNRAIAVSKTFPIKIVCGVKKVDLSGNRTYFPLTHFEHTLQESTGMGGDAPEDKDVWIPVQFKAEVKVGGTTVQQVPAPRLDTSSSDKAYWVRVDMGVYHNRDNSAVRDTVQGIDGSRGKLAAGWAECLVPQFGMDTTCLATANADGEPTWESKLRPWINNVCARAGYTENGLGKSAATIFAQLSEDLDPPDDGYGDYIGNGHYYTDGDFELGGSIRGSIGDWLFNDDGKDWEKLSDGLWSGWLNEEDTSCADLMHQWRDAGADLQDRMWIVDGKFGTGDNGRTASRVNNEIYTRFRAGGVKSVADLGSIMIGPYETLSLFKMWRSPGRELTSSDPDSDFHPVFDYFTMEEDRYPTADDIAGTVSEDGTVDWDKLGTRSSAPKQRHLFSAVQSGRVNLNLPRLLEPYETQGDKVVRVKRADYFNPYPLAAALNGAPYPGLKNGSREMQGVSDEAAVNMASAYAAMLSHVDKNPRDDEYRAATVYNQVTNLVEFARKSKNAKVESIHAPVVRDVSFFMSGGGTSSNAVLKAFLDGVGSSQRQNLCDDMREGVLRGVADSFATRGQSFMLVLRADAFTARYGQQEDPTSGTSLASSYALVELFRDPEPARLPDGTFPRDDDGNPVLYHNWFIRSFRMF